MKIVINRCFGGFGLSDKAMHRYAELKGIKLYPEKDKFGLTTYYTVPEGERVKELPGRWMDHSEEDRKAYNEAYSSQYIYSRDIARSDEHLVQVVEELGDSASGDFAKLAIVEIPDGVEWEISEYDGNEHVAQKHATWY